MDWPKPFFLLRNIRGGLEKPGIWFQHWITGVKKAIFPYSISANGGYPIKQDPFLWESLREQPDGNWLPATPWIHLLRYTLYDGVFPNEEAIEAETPWLYRPSTNQLSSLWHEIKDYGRGWSHHSSGPGQVGQTKHIPRFQEGEQEGFFFRKWDMACMLFQGAAGASLLWLKPWRIRKHWKLTWLEFYEKQVGPSDNESNEYPRIANRVTSFFPGGNDFWYRSSDYIRRKNLGIGYTVPPAKLGRKNLVSATWDSITNATETCWLWDKLKSVRLLNQTKCHRPVLSFRQGLSTQWVVP